MKKYKLSNELTVIEEKRPSDSVTIQITVKVGSNDEKNGIRGISHFIEHMVFEGTVNRKNAKDISNEIESLGGEINAYTDNIRTSFYIKVPKKHFPKAADILSDIIMNPLFRDKDVNKERQVILKEINIFNDESRFYQWILFLGALFKNHPTKYPAYGTREDVKRITRKDMLNYFRKYYVANNSILSVVGNAKSCKQILGKYFGSLNSGRKIEKKKFYETNNSSFKIVKTKRKIMNSYMVFGYKTVPRLHIDSYALDVIQGILGRGQSGRIFDEIRNKRVLAYEVGVHHDSSTDFGYFAVYLSADKCNIKLIKRLIMEELGKLDKINNKELSEAIGYIEGKHILDTEDTHNKADSLSVWDLFKDARLEKHYLNNIRKVRIEDIKRVSKKYLSDNYTMAIIEQN
jgi:predicted Zn-dependent peptidase